MTLCGIICNNRAILRSGLALPHWKRTSEFQISNKSRNTLECSHLAGNICATRPNRSSGRRRPPRRRRCPSATHRPALRSIDRRSKSASDPRTLLAPPPIPAATPAASSALQCAEKRRGGARPAMDDEGSAGRASAGPVAPSARGTCRRPDDSRRTTADGGAVGAAAAAPPVGGALVVAWAALRRRSGRPGSGGSLRRHGFERGCLSSSGAAWLRAVLAGAAPGPRSFFY